MPFLGLAGAAGGLGGFGSILKLALPLVGSLLKPSAPSPAPPPAPPQAPAVEPAEPKGTLDEEAVRARALKRRQNTSAKSLLFTSGEEEVKGPTLLGE